MSAAAQTPTVRFEFTFMEYLTERDVPALPARAEFRRGPALRSEVLRYRDIPLTRWRGLCLRVRGPQRLRIEDVEVVRLVEQIGCAGRDGVVVVLVAVGDARVEHRARWHQVIEHRRRAGDHLARLVGP